MKKIITILLALCMVGTMFSGCGDKSGKQAANGKTQINFSTWLNKGEDTPVIEGFMKANPDITVKTDVMDGTQYPQLLQPRFMSGDAPDVMLVMIEMYDKYVTEDWLLDLSELEISKKMDTNEGISEYFKKDGKYYGVPITGGYSVNPIYYNKKIFNELGISIPTTNEEFYLACEKIKASGIDPITFGGADSWTIGSLCGPIMTASNMKYGVKFDEKIVDGTLKYSQLNANTYNCLELITKKGYVGKNALTMKYEQSMQYFADGKAAMVAQGSWVPELPEILAADKNKFELGAFVNPLLEKADNGKVNIKISPDRTLIVSKNTKNPEACKKLVEYFTGDAVMKEYLEKQNSDTMFTHLNLEKPAVFKDFYDTLFDENKYHMISGTGTYNMPAAVTNSVNESYQNILSGSSAAVELEKADKIFEDNKDKVVKK